MIVEWLIKESSNDSVTVLFLGWSCDTNSVEVSLFKNTDVILLYDYSDIDSFVFSLPDITNYKKKILLAWSFGVWAADYLCDRLGSFDYSVAINGTPLPVDNNYGINKRVFDITLKGINKGGTDVFTQNMYGNRKDLIRDPVRDDSSKILELKALSEMFKEPLSGGISWDEALISDCDKIIPFDNMFNYWNKRGIFVTILRGANHYPFCDIGIAGLKILRDL